MVRVLNSFGVMVRVVVRVVDSFGVIVRVMVGIRVLCKTVLFGCKTVKTLET